MSVTIAGTQRNPWPGASPAHPLESDTVLTLTAWLRPRPGSEVDAAAAFAEVVKHPRDRSYATAAQLRDRTNADPADFARFTEYCESKGVEVTERHWRSVSVRAPVGRLTEAFGATVSTYVDANGRPFRHRSGALTAPADVSAMLYGIFGLHQWPRSRRIGSLQRHVDPLTAQQIAARYAFPQGDGAGQTVGVLQFSGTFKEDDFDACMRSQNVATARPAIKRIDDAALQHEFDTTKDLEAALDSQIIAALAPSARIVIYQAPDDERGFLDAIRSAIFDSEFEPSILSISYGWPELLWTPAALEVMNALFTVAAFTGVSVFCASGDNGAELDYDGAPHVLAPASNAFVHACGATSIVVDAGGEREIAWERSGGGFSEHVETPPWQHSPKRGIPDIVGQETPGYCVYLEGTELAMGGTSAVAPMLAALAARLNQSLNGRMGLITPLLHASQPALLLREITEGANDAYRASAGWNPCTGLGVPIGSAIAAALR